MLTSAGQKMKDGKNWVRIYFERGFWKKTGGKNTVGRVVEAGKGRVGGTGVFSATRRSGERSGVGGMVLLTTDKLRLI